MTDEQQKDPLGDPLSDPLGESAETPAGEASEDETPADKAPTDRVPAETTPTVDAPADESPADQSPAVEENEKTAERAPRGPGDTAERQPLAAPPPAYVRLHLQGNVLLSMITPKVLIDGQPAPAQYGENLFPVAPGPHVVSAHAQWMWQYGKAEQPVSLAPGETAEIYYATPVLTFLPGAMGATKQKHPGMMVLLLLCGVALAFVVALLVFALGT